MYQDFFPSAGLYSYLNGFILDKFFNNEYFNLNYAYAFRNIITLTVFTVVIARVFGKFETLLIILLFFINTGYERPILIIPFFFILNFDRVKKDEIIWLSIWAIFCLFSILYYPLYGAAISLGTLPMALYYANNVRLKLKNKVEIPNLKLKICLFVGSCVVVLMFLPLMFRELYNIALFSKQTVMVDGISVIRNAQNVRFPKYLASERLGTAFYQIFIIYILVLIPSLVFSYIPRAVVLFKNNSDNQNEKKYEYLNILFAIVCVFIVTMVVYSYSLVRIAPTDFVGKNTQIYAYMVGFIFIYYVIRFIYLSEKKSVYDVITLSMLTGIIIFSTGSAQFNAIGTKANVINYDENYVYYENSEIPNLGSGIIKKEDLSELLILKDYIEKFNTTVWLFNGKQGYYHILNLDTNFVSAGTFVAAKDMQELYFKESLDTMPNVIFSEELILINYYLTKSFIDYGYVYVIDENNRTFFMKEDFFNSYYTDEEKANLRYSRKFTFDGVSPYFWANSLDAIVKETIQPQETTLNNLTEVATNQLVNQDGLYTVADSTDPYIDFKINEPIEGFDNDVIYLEVEITDTDGVYADDFIQVYYRNIDEDYTEDTSVILNALERPNLSPFNNNQTNVRKYLVPMGVSAKYLTSDIDGLRIDFNNLGVGSNVKINKIDFYKYPSYEETVNE